MTLKEFINFYKNTFTPIYADTVAFLADKPAQIIIELENTFAHLTKYLDRDNATPVRNDNLTKAYNHLLRTTIDCYKMLWVEMDEQIEFFMGNDNSRKFAVNIPENEATTLWLNFKEKAKEARRQEMDGIGITPVDTIDAYKNTVAIGWEILKKCDQAKINSLKSFSLKYLIKQQWIGFIFGIVAGIIGNIIFSKF